MKRLALIALTIVTALLPARAQGNACLTDAQTERDICVQETARNFVQKRRCIARYNAMLDHCSALPSDPLNPAPPPGYADPLNPALPRSDPVQPRVNPVHPRTEPIRPGMPR